MRLLPTVLEQLICLPMAHCDAPDVQICGCVGKYTSLPFEWRHKRMQKKANHCSKDASERELKDVLSMVPYGDAKAMIGSSLAVTMSKTE